jgi:hypothetical protein
MSDLDKLTAKGLLEILDLLGNQNNPIIRVKASIDENNKNEYKILDK